ncbi:hypothetical protein [Burkholderia cepacia]|uniref:hypothetical protein n=1 Tax=Burkholderia cepacia TaxID=292 RepID=UPI000ACCE987|nr:hypothetical protein [Burkholderia cepacia]
MNDQQQSRTDALTPCVHADDPKACYHVRCQLGGKCVNDDMSPRQPAAAPIVSAPADERIDDEQRIEAMARAMNVATDGHDRYWTGYVPSAGAALRALRDSEKAATSANETGAEGAIISQSDETQRMVREIALKYCAYEKGGEYNVLRYECDEDFFNFVHEAAIALSRSPAMAAAAPADERAAFGPEWMPVKRERIEELKRLANTQFEESYQGRGLYDDDALLRNEQLCTSTLADIDSTLGWIDEDLKDLELARAAASPAAAIPAGWKPMPPMLTSEMRMAIAKAAAEYMRRTGGNSPDAIYEAAFAAAPQPAKASPAAEALEADDDLKHRTGAEHFACYLIDRCEWETVTEENVQSWIDAMLKLPRYTRAPQPAQADAPAEAREVIEPLKEPVTIRKALLAGRTARVVLSGGVGPVAAVHLVNIGLTGWVHTKETAEAYAKGFNQAAKWMQDAMRCAPADAGEAAIPRVHGISHSADNPCTVLVKLMAEPSDDALRAIHNMLTAPPAARVASLTREQKATINWAIRAAVEAGYTSDADVLRAFLNGADHA